MEYTLDATNLTQDVNAPAKSQRLKIGFAGTWVGTVDVKYTINGGCAERDKTLFVYAVRLGGLLTHTT